MLGRIFIILNLILAGGFLFSGFQLLKKTENYKNKYEAEQRAHEADKKSSADEIGKKDAARTDAEKAKSAAESASNQLKGENGALNSRVQSNETALGEQRAQLAKIAADLDNFRQTIESLQKQLGEASKANDSMRQERDEARKAQENAENELATAKDANKQLEAKGAALMASVTEKTEQLKVSDTALAVYAEKTGIPINDVKVAPPLITGNVSDVNNEYKILQLTVGSDSNVKRGYSFSIYRGSQYKGEAIVEDVQPKFATARITKMVAGIKVEPGDMATTRLF